MAAAETSTFTQFRANFAIFGQILSELNLKNRRFWKWKLSSLDSPQCVEHQKFRTVAI